MTQITEDYVSYEVAKLLKEKGFDEKVHTFYISETEIVNTNIKHNYNGESIYLSALTYQMAMKWLREVHNLFIWVTYHTGSGLNWSYEIHSIKDGKTLRSQLVVAGSYETCVESAIKYCLENLI